MAIDSKFLVNLSGRDYPLFAGILNEAHERGLQSITVELIQIPTAENDHTAIMQATVTMKDGSQFSDFGDASPRNTNARIATALLRMASTRAKGRALRDAINVGQTMLEELPDLDDAQAPPSGNGKARVAASMERNEQPAPVVAKAGAQPPAPSPPPGARSQEPGADYDWDLCSEPGCGKPLTEGMKNTSRANFHRPLCPPHQKAAMEAKKAAQG
jgi:hypothetical protein